MKTKLAFCLALFLAACSPAPEPQAPPVDTTKSLDASTFFPQAKDEPAAPHSHDKIHPPVELEGKGPAKKQKRSWIEVFVKDAHAQITTPKDTVPDFGANPTIISAASGEWDRPATWQQGRVPVDGDVVRIAVGHDVTYSIESDVGLQAIGIEGRLRLSSGVPTRIKACNYLVYRGGIFQVGERANPARVKAEVITRDCPINTLQDPKAFGTGIINFGRRIMHGEEKTPWVKLAQEPKAGSTTLVLSEAPKNWKPGDKVVIPGTKQIPLAYQSSTVPAIQVNTEVEEGTIASIDGATVTLNSQLQFDHLFGRDTDGNVVGVPHVGNISRTIVIRSENPNGFRGHTLDTERARFSIAFVAHENLGRTTVAAISAANLIGRYPVHFHHYMGEVNPTNTGYQGEFNGNVVNNGRKWCIAVHNSHWIRVVGNVLYQCDGAGIQTEQGNETGSLFEKNFVVSIGKTINIPYHPTYGGVAGAGRPLGFADFGWEGSCYWFNGQNNIVRDNIAANCAFAGVMYNERPSGFAPNHPLIPKFRGAQIGDVTQWTDYTKPYTGSPSVIESARNIVYASTVGTWVSFGGVIGTLKDYLMWNIRQQGIYYGRSASMTLENFVVVSQQEVSNINGRTSTGAYPSPATLNKGLDAAGTTYTAGGLTIIGGKIEGFQMGIALPGNTASVSPNLFPGVATDTVITGLTLRNYVNMVDLSPHIVKSTTLRDVTFIQNPGPKNSTLSPTPMSIISAMEGATVDANIMRLSRLLSYNHNKQGVDMEFFFPEQASGYLMKPRQYPSGVYSPLQNCPEQGLTNFQCREKYGVSTLDRIATCPTQVPEMRGFWCPLVP